MTPLRPPRDSDTTPDGEQSLIQALADETLGSLAIDPAWFSAEDWTIVSPSTATADIQVYGLQGEPGSRTMRVRIVIDAVTEPSDAAAGGPTAGDDATRAGDNENSATPEPTDDEIGAAWTVLTRREIERTYPLATPEQHNALMAAAVDAYDPDASPITADIRAALWAANSRRLAR